MLALTQNAAAVIGTMTERFGMSDGAGLRISTTHDGQTDLTVEPSDSPADGDQVVEAEGTRVFVEAAAIAALDDKLLDAEIDDNGRIQFLLVEHPHQDPRKY